MKITQWPWRAYLKKHKTPVALIVIILLILIVWRPFFSARKKPVALLPVKAASVIERPIPLVLKAIGTVESIDSAVITPQVTGTITQINFRPGQRVKKGQLLFTIQSNTFNALLQQAEATLQRDQAQLDYLKANAKRYASLVNLEYVTRDQYEQTEAAANAQAALVKVDKALIDQAKIQLGYTSISAPVSGKLGNYTVRVGDLVVANGASLLTINQLDTVWVDFNIPQSDLQKILYYQHQKRLHVDIWSEDESERLGQAVLSFIDNSVDPKTGTVLLKAEADNHDDRLWPGEMVKVVLRLTMQKDALVIPLSSVQFDNEGSFVYVFENGKAVVRNIKIARQTGTLAVVESGLKKGELVLTTIPPDLTDGAAVELVK